MPSERGVRASGFIFFANPAEKLIRHFTRLQRHNLVLLSAFPIPHTTPSNPLADRSISYQHNASQQLIALNVRDAAEAFDHRLDGANAWSSRSVN